jgi:hypothetical protein
MEPKTSVWLATLPADGPDRRLLPMWPKRSPGSGSVRETEGSMIEHLRPGVTAHSARVVLFDFDGTLSTIRSGWVEIMVPMMVEVLADLKTGETEAELTEIVKEYVGRLTGKETISQIDGVRRADR